MEFSALLKQSFHLNNDQAIRIHINHDLGLQPIFQTMAGYHYADDADELRIEPLFTTLLNKPTLASPLTLSHFINRLTKESSQQLEQINKKR